jgi:hypothetical protein
MRVDLRRRRETIGCEVRSRSVGGGLIIDSVQLLPGLRYLLLIIYYTATRISIGKKKKNCS